MSAIIRVLSKQANAVWVIKLVLISRLLVSLRRRRCFTLLHHLLAKLSQLLFGLRLADSWLVFGLLRHSSAVLFYYNRLCYFSLWKERLRNRIRRTTFRWLIKNFDSHGVLVRLINYKSWRLLLLWLRFFLRLGRKEVFCNFSLASWSCIFLAQFRFLIKWIAQSFLISIVVEANDKSSISLVLYQWSL